MSQIKFLILGNKYATVEARYESSEKAREFSTLQLENMVMLPLYLGKRRSKIQIKNIAPETNIGWLVVILLGGHEEKLDIIQITRYPSTNWRGQVLEALVQATDQDLELIPRDHHGGK